MQQEKKVNSDLCVSENREREYFDLCLLPDARFPMSVEPVNCGRETVVSHSYRWNGLHRGTEPALIWQYTLSGRGAIVRGGSVFDLTPGCSFFVEIPDDHVYYLPADSDRWEFIFFSFRGSDALRLSRIFREQFGFILRHAPDSESVRACFDLLEQLREHGIGDRFFLSERTYHFLCTMFREFELKRTGHRISLAERVGALVMENPERALSVENLALRFGCSRTHFTRLFHAETGTAPAEFMLNLRLRLACRLLETEPLPLKEIAFRTGFSSPEYFCRAFRREYGSAPGLYRRKMKDLNNIL